MKIYAAMSVFEEEDHMLNSAINSVSMLDGTFVFDGSTKGMKNKLDNTTSSRRITPEMKPYSYYTGNWKGDADKRTEILKWIQAVDEDSWLLWLDGDEILLYGEYLRNHCYRADQETATGGTTIRIVEYDGSVAQCYGKLIKVANVKKYVMSSYEIELESGMTVALPNVPICSMGGIPIGDISDRDSPILALNRPPLMGEPHLLHRHGLRNPERKAPRLHEEEANDFEKLVEGN